MNFYDTPLKDLYLIEPRVFSDERGYFFESFNAKSTLGTPLENYNWVQDNESQSVKGVLRGLHFQKGDHSQAKLVRVISGSVFDVAVDMRSNSPTFGKWFGTVLSSDDKMQMLIPKGFAHGFLVLSDKATFTYKCDDFYQKEAESGIMYNDPDIGIAWPDPEVDLIISEKDQHLPNFDSSYKF